MIKLNENRKLQALLAGAAATAQPAVVVSYNDKGAGFDGETALMDLSDTTPVDICPAPAADEIRHIDYLTIRNYDSAQVVVTVRIDDSGTPHNLIDATLEAGEMLGYTHSAGWYVNTADGSRKSGAVQDLSGYQLTSSKDASGGYVGKTGHAINFYNLLGSIVSLFNNANTAIRTYLFPDRSGTVALLDDVALKADIASPTFTGTPLAPTAADGTNTTQIATTQFTTTAVANAVSALVASSPAALDTLNELAAALGNDASFATTTATALGNRLRVDTAAQALSGTQQTNALTNLGFSANAQSLVGAANYAAMKVLLSLDNVENKSSATIRGELTSGNVTAALTFTPENAANKDASGGYVGLTLFKINFKNALNTFTSFFTNANTAARTYTFQDRNGTIADDTDLALKANIASPTFTGTVGGITAAMVGLGNVNNTSNATERAATATLTNKRITFRVLSEAFSATPTINTDSYDEYHATAMSGAITSMTSNLTGTPVTGDIMMFEFTDDGTARAIAWGTKFESSTVPLPTTTVISTLLTVTTKWNAATNKWRCVGVA
jgi:hypothetical protein